MFNNPIFKATSLIKNSVGVVLFFVCGFAIYNKLLIQSDWQNLKQSFSIQLQSIGILNWGILIFLLFLNIWMEAIKWKIIVAKNNPITMAASIKSILVGQAFAFFTPNRIGEYAGRTMFLSAGNQMKGITQMAWTSYAQLLITICIGSIGLWVNIAYYPWMQTNGMLLVKLMTPFLLILALFLFFHEKHWKGKLSFLNVIQIEPTVKLKLLGLSLLRYLIFIVQYGWIAYLLQMKISVEVLFLSLSILFLLLSILPTISITELVVRGQLLILILKPFYSHQVTIVSLSSIIWGINFLVPAILGTCLLLGYRINK